MGTASAPYSSGLGYAHEMAIVDFFILLKSSSVASQNRGVALLYNLQLNVLLWLGFIVNPNAKL